MQGKIMGETGRLTLDPEEGFLAFFCTLRGRNSCRNRRLARKLYCKSKKVGKREIRKETF